MISEKNYSDYLEELFRDRFGPENVEREVYTDSGRFCDFVIETELVTLAVEVENTSEDVVQSGVGQALLYAQEVGGLPVVVYPPDEKDNDAELAALSAFAEITTIPYKL